MSAPVIVVGYDGSATSRAAVDWAARRAGSDGKVFVVHACGSLESDDHGRAVLDALVLDDDPLLGTDFETELLDAPAAEAIARKAEACGADEIVVGSRGLGRVRAALGSVSHEVLHRARVPVVVIPPAES
jgi:nucleotide-binding universal stress UspA family protein